MSSKLTSGNDSILQGVMHWILAAEASPWDFGWEALVAIGTLALALATAALALSTRKLSATTAAEVEHSGQLVKESQRQVEASQNQVEASQEQARTAREALAAAHVQTQLAQLTLNAQIRPVLVDVPPDLSQQEPIYYAGRESPVTGTAARAHRRGWRRRDDLRPAA